MTQLLYALAQIAGILVLPLTVVVSAIRDWLLVTGWF